MSERLQRGLWLTAGLACVAIGGIGIVVPGLPTTVFFIMAAGAFARSNERLEAWVLGLPGIGKAVSDYRAGLGMPRRAKVLALTMLTAAVLVSTILVDVWWIRGVILAVGAIGFAYIWRIPTTPTSLRGQTPT